VISNFVVKKRFRRHSFFVGGARRLASGGKPAAAMSGSVMRMFAWARTKTPKIDREALAARVGEVIADYSAFISNNPGVAVLRDVTRLPHDREKIVMALCFATATRDVAPRMRKSLAECALSLAYFQPNVGERDLFQSRRDAAEYVTSGLTGEPTDEERYAGFLPAVQADRALINLQINAAIDLWTKTRRAALPSKGDERDGNGGA
jgi:hypothetical protein